VSKCEQLSKNLEGCTCTYVACERRGACCACIAYHRGQGQLPGCLFPPEAEKDYDRSARHYVKGMQGRV
jgi:hypothetical protein